jgi:SAM-dependent methyltransferase
MPDLNKRSYTKELMDEFDAGGKDMYRTLNELETINRLLGGHNVTASALKLCMGSLDNKAKEITIADIGCGGGDGLRFISKWAKNKNLKVRLLGIDANVNIIEYAKAKSIGYPEIDYLVADIFSDKFLEVKPDIMVFALFCHHFNEEALAEIFKRAYQQVRIGFVINDLQRHPLAYHSIKILTSLFSKSPMIKNDAPLSVARGFSKSELIKILALAGITNYIVRWQWAFRWKVLVRK